MCPQNPQLLRPDLPATGAPTVCLNVLQVLNFPSWQQRCKSAAHTARERFQPHLCTWETHWHLVCGSPLRWWLGCDSLPRWWPEHRSQPRQCLGYVDSPRLEPTQVAAGAWRNKLQGQPCPSLHMPLKCGTLLLWWAQAFSADNLVVSVPRSSHFRLLPHSQDQSFFQICPLNPKFQHQPLPIP